MTSLQCVEAFSPAQPGEEQNREGYGPQSGQYLHSWGGVVTGIKAQDNMLGLGLLFEDVEWSEEGQIVI